MSEALLEAVDLSCERDDRILFQNLNFALRPGSLTRVEGANGAGKTTLLRMLCGLAPVQSGDLRWRGQPLAQVRDSFLRQTLYIGHRTGVKSLLTPLENLQSHLRPRRRVTDVQILAALGRVGLGGYEDVPCHSLSAGQQRRVALSRLLLSDEPLWILDEAFTAIDRHGVQTLESLLRQRAGQGGTILMTTHHEFDAPGLQRIQLIRGSARVEWAAEEGGYDS